MIILYVQLYNNLLILFHYCGFFCVYGVSGSSFSTHFFGIISCCSLCSMTRCMAVPVIRFVNTEHHYLSTPNNPNQLYSLASQQCLFTQYFLALRNINRPADLCFAFHSQKLNKILIIFFVIQILILQVQLCILFCIFECKCVEQSKIICIKRQVTVCKISFLVAAAKIAALVIL